MRKISLFIFVLGFIIVSCKQKSISNIENLNRVVDSVIINDRIGIDDVAKDLLQTYYTKYGIAIPTYYLVKDSIAIDLNNDNIIDTLVLLSPVTLEKEEYAQYQLENNPNRILVEIIANEKSTNIRNTYYNQISNIGGVLSKYNGITITDKGFNIQHTSGSRYSWTYIVKYSTEFEDSIYLTGIEKICAYEGIEKKQEYTYTKKSLHDFNLQDTIDIDCNCDKTWMSIQADN